MLLLIDAGNTRIKWGIPHKQQVPAPTPPAWLVITSIPHHEIDDLAIAWQQYPVSKVLISNVAGAEVKARLTTLLLQTFPEASVEWFASQAECAGVTNQYLHPQQLGCDRFASAIAAAYLYPQQHLIVATCGTATTVDAVTAQASFEGGMILPGLKLMAESLARNTASAICQQYGSGDCQRLHSRTSGRDYLGVSSPAKKTRAIGDVSHFGRRGALSVATSPISM